METETWSVADVTFSGVGRWFHAILDHCPGEILDGCGSEQAAGQQLWTGLCETSGTLFGLFPYLGLYDVTFCVGNTVPVSRTL